MTDRQFPVDIHAAKKYGIEKWQKEFFWPVSDRDFAVLCDDIDQCLRRHINDQPEEISDLLLIAVEMRSEYRHFLHALMVTEKVKNAGLDLLYSDKSLWYKDIVTGNYPISWVEPKRKDERLASRLKGNANKFLMGLYHNFDISKLYNSTKTKDRTIVYGPLRPIMSDYIKRSPSMAHFTLRRDWLLKNASYGIAERLTDSIKEMTTILMSDLKAIANGHKIRLGEKQISYLTEFTKAALTDAAKMFYLANIKVNRSGKLRLAVSGYGDSFSRALYITVRENGGSITGFSHGGSIGLYNVPTFAFSEFSLANEFITYTQGSVGNFEEIKNNHKPVRQNAIQIKSCDSDEFLKLWKRYCTMPLPSKIKRVMIIGYPHNPWRKPHASASLALMQLDFELRVIDIMKKSGYEVFYKVHPDRVPEVEGIFETRAKVIKGYFENCLDSADAYIFGSIRTTAFPFALCANKPIISFIMKDEYCKPFSSAMELLKKRCSVVSTKFDERNRIAFDKDALLSALSKPVKEPDNEFIETYYFP